MTPRDSTGGTGAGDEPAEEPLTLTQIARRVGVSAATVSKVINGRPDVGPRTRALVEEVIGRYGYRRRKKAAGPAGLIELVFHEVIGPYPVEIFQGVHRVAQGHRMAVVLSELQGKHTPGHGWAEEILARRPAGVVAVFSSLTDAQHRQLSARGIPLVLVDPSGEPGRLFPSVGAGNWAGGLSATRHLLRLGHRRIAVLAGPAYALSGRARLGGYRAAMGAAGVAVDEGLVRASGFQVEDGLFHTRELLRLADPPTAVFACNDGQALGAYRAAAEAGVRIPEDLSVVGFDDLFPVQWAYPALTTVRQPLADMAAAAAEMVLTLARGEPLPRPRAELATELIVRDSTARPAR
jgi:DNA-binding LacI/PurR family transcriptional regulator